MRTILVVAICLLLAAGAAFAQGDRGTITGTIADPAGAVIPGVSIEAKNSETGAVYQAASTSTGNYVLTQLPAGVYQLSASVVGFKQYIRTGITVLVAQTLRIDVVLEVGNIAETVTVNADAALLKTESGELSHNITGDRLNSLPVEGFSVTIRDPYAVTQLVPGTVYQDRVYVRVNGAPANSQALRVEGQDATNQFFLSSTPQSQPSVEAIEEFGIQTSNYSPEFGQAGGGFFNVTMKSGSNAFHGSVYEYWSNEAFNANQPFINVRQRVRAHDYGFTFGGPVWIPKVYDGHDKTFFFLSFERYPNNVVNTSVQQVPTLAYRNGDFSGALTGRNLCPTTNPNCDPLGKPIMEGTIYDPKTERLVNGVRYRDAFPNNRIPLERFDPVAAKIQALIPLPTDNTTPVNNYFHPWLGPFLMTIPAFKIDHNLSVRSKLSFYFSKTGQHAKEQLGYAGGDGIDTPVTTSMPQDVQAYTTRLNFDQTLAPTMILHLGAGLQNLSFIDQVKQANFDQLKELGLPGANATIFPNITGLTAARGGMKNMGPSAQSFAHMLKPTANASLTWVKSNHTYKFGAEMRIEGYPDTVVNPAYGLYNFSADQTGLPSTLGQNLQGGTLGFPYASFLLGLVNNGNIGVVTNTRLGKSAWALFAQDTWKVTRRLTLDYGLRWDYQTYLREQYGRAANFSPTTPNPSAGGLMGAVIFEGAGPGHCNCDFAKIYPYAFGPRLGAAYKILSKTVLRAGLGVMYAQTGSLSHSQYRGQWSSTNLFVSPSYDDPAMVLRNGPPTPTAFPNLDPGQFPFPGTLSAPPVAIDRNAGRPPRMIQWSISIQHEISKNLAVEASYVGNRGAWWEGNSLIDVNGLTADRIAKFGLDINSAADRTLLTSRLDSSKAAQRGFNKPPYAGFPMSSTVAQALRPFPQFSGAPAIRYIWAPVGRTWYDSMQLKVTKRFSHGLDFTSVFSWQKELMMGSEQVGGIDLVVPAINDVYNRGQNKYISGLSRPLSWATALNYRMPTLGGNKVLSQAIRDWTIGVSVNYTSGMPFLAPIAQNQLASVLFRSTFANRVPGESLYTVDLNCHCYDPSTTFVLNPKAWADPPAGQFGTGPAYYNDYRQQRRPLENGTIGRVFRIREKAQLSIRVDFQNIFNRAVWNNPTSTNALATQTKNPTTGVTISGFGRVNTLVGTGILGRTPRQGMLVARFSF